MAGEKTIWNLTAILGMNIAEFQTKLNEAKTQTQNFTKTMGTVKDALIGVFSVAAIGEFMKSSIQAYGELQKHEDILLNALHGRRDAQEDLIRQAEEIQGTTLFSKEEVMQAQAYGASLGLNIDQIKKLSVAAADLATITGLGLFESAKLLGKTYEGSLGKLAQIFPELKLETKGLTKEALEAGSAIDLVLSKMGGAAMAADNGPIGNIKKLADAWKELKINAGETLIPIANVAVKAATGILAPSWQQRENKSFEDMKQWDINKLLYGGSQYTPLNALKDTTSEAEKTKKAIEELKKSWDAFWNPKVKKGGLPIAKSEGEFGNQVKGITEFGPIPEGPSGGPFSDLQASLTQAMSNVGENIMAPLHPIIVKGLEQAFDIKQDEIDNISKRLHLAFKKIGDGAKISADELNKTIGDEIGVMSILFADQMSALLSGDIKFNKGFFLPFLKELGKFLEQFGAALIVYGIGFKALKNPVTAIWAGIAMLAAGAILCGLANKGLSGVAGGGGGGEGSGSTSSWDENSYWYKNADTANKTIEVKVTGELRADKLYITNQRGSQIYKDTR